MPRLLPRPDDQIAEAAERLRPLWREGDPVDLWLRRHLAVLDAMQDEGWSWPDIARALTAAGIGFRTGRPWTAEHLRARIKEARKAAARLGEIRPSKRDRHAGILPSGPGRPGAHPAGAAHPGTAAVGNAPADFQAFTSAALAGAALAQALAPGGAGLSRSALFALLKHLADDQSDIDPQTSIRAGVGQIQTSTTPAPSTPAPGQQGPTASGPDPNDPVAQAEARIARGREEDRRRAAERQAEADAAAAAKAEADAAAAPKPKPAEPQMSRSVAIRRAGLTVHDPASVRTGKQES